MGLAGRGGMPLPPMPGDGAGRTGAAIGCAAGRGAAGAGAAGLGAAGFAAAGLRAGALRAGFRAAFLAVLRAVVFLTVVVRRPPAFLLVVRFFPLFLVAMALLRF